MKTPRIIVELYDKEPLENALAACIFQPELLVFVCDVRDSSLRKEQAVLRFLKSRSLKTKARFYYIETSKPKMIERLLYAILRDYPDCVFDFSGGKDLVLLTAGVFAYKNNISAFYIDIPTAKFVNLRNCESLEARFALPQLSAQDVFALGGAQMVGNGHFPQEQIDKTFADIALQVWEKIFKNTKGWNELAGFLQAASSGKAESDLTVNAPLVLKVNNQTTARCHLPLLEELAQCGAIKDLSSEDDRVHFVYPHERMKKCLQNHGIWLELFAFLTTQHSGFFHDVRTSVIVDWDNATELKHSTRNEIDVLATRGIVPIFISCKMGVPTPLALSEIKMLSEKFGGARTKTVLLTASNVRASNPALMQRAKELDVWILDRSDLGQGDLAQRLLQISKKN